MGAKTSMLVVTDRDAKAVLATHPTIDREASVRSLSTYFPDTQFGAIADGSLGSTYPSEDEVYIGHFSGVTVLAASEFLLDYPSQLNSHFLKVAGQQSVFLHSMHSAVDFFGYGVWRNGVLLRSLSLAPDYGILEETGDRPEFERPFWAGEHPADDPEELKDPDYVPYPFPFHPLELGEAALREFFGYQLEGFIDASLTDPDRIPLLRFKRK